MLKNKISSISLFLLVVFLLLIILLKNINVEINYYTGKDIGLFKLNNLFFYGEYNKTYDIISDLYLYLSLTIVLTYLLRMYIEFKKNKEISNLKNIFLIIIFFLIMFLITILFDKIFIINYRPIFENNKLEGSFPSTHIMIITFTNLMFLSINNKQKNKIITKKVSFYIIIINIIIISIIRVLSGMHWITDIIGGILIGLILYFQFLKIISKENLNV